MIIGERRILIKGVKVRVRLQKITYKRNDLYGKEIEVVRLKANAKIFDREKETENIYRRWDVFHWDMGGKYGCNLKVKAHKLKLTTDMKKITCKNCEKYLNSPSEEDLM